MIWYLLTSMRKKNRQSDNRSLCCWKRKRYVLCGVVSNIRLLDFFYSGITPSATGGRPVRLYYMNKDGNKGSDSTIVLMTVAVIYKIVLVVLGVGMLLFAAAH